MDEGLATSLYFTCVYVCCYVQCPIRSTQVVGGGGGNRRKKPFHSMHSSILQHKYWVCVFCHSSPAAFYLELETRRPPTPVTPLLPRSSSSFSHSLPFLVYTPYFFNLFRNMYARHHCECSRVNCYSLTFSKAFPIPIKLSCIHTDICIYVGIYYTRFPLLFPTFKSFFSPFPSHALQCRHLRNCGVVKTISFIWKRSSVCLVYTIYSRPFNCLCCSASLDVFTGVKLNIAQTNTVASCFYHQNKLNTFEPCKKGYMKTKWLQNYPNSLHWNM